MQLEELHAQMWIEVFQVRGKLRGMLSQAWRQGRARRDVTCSSGCAVEKVPQGSHGARSKKPPAVRVPGPQPARLRGPHSILTLPHPARAGGPEPRPASPSSPPARSLASSGWPAWWQPCLLPGEPAAGLMALMEGGRPPSCQSGGAPRSPSWLERGGWAGAGAGLSGPSQR